MGAAYCDVDIDFLDILVARVSLLSNELLLFTWLCFMPLVKEQSSFQYIIICNIIHKHGKIASVFSARQALCGCPKPGGSGVQREEVQRGRNRRSRVTGW